MLGNNAENAARLVQAIEEIFSTLEENTTKRELIH